MIKDNIKKITNIYITMRKELDKYFVYILSLYAFIMPWNSQYTEKMVHILFYIFLISFNYKKFTYDLKSNKLYQVIIVLSLLILLSYLWSSGFVADTIMPHQAYSNIDIYYYNYIIYFLFPLILTTNKLNNNAISLLISAFMFGMFVNETISYGIVFGLWTTSAGSPSDPIPYHISHITYSAFVGFTVLIAIYRLVHIQENYKKLFYFIFLLTMTINLFMSAGRTGQFSLFITSIILMLIYFKTKIKALLLSIFILIFSFFIAFIYSPTFQARVLLAQESIQGIINNEHLDSSLGTRIMAFKTLPYLINKHNIYFGVGIGDKAIYVSETLQKNFPYRLINFDYYGYLHNSHIEMLVSNGVVGLFFYLSIFYFLLKIKINDPFIQYLSYSLGIYMLCYGMVADIFFFHEVMSFFSFFLGIIIFQQQAEKHKLCNNDKNKDINSMHRLLKC